MSGRTIALGDIHGCADALQAVLDAISPQPDDLLVALGDYIDRGPNSRGVLDQLIALQTRCRFQPLKGNHEIMLLDALERAEMMEFWLQYGGRETAASYGGQIEQIPEEHLAFMRNCAPYHETDSHIFVHANYDHDSPLDDQPDQRRYWEHMIEPGPPPHQSGKIVVVGHTPQASAEILHLGHLICIDTGCYGGGWLTALEVNTGKIWQADEQGQLRLE